MVSKFLRRSNLGLRLVTRPALTMHIGQKYPKKTKTRRSIFSAGMCFPCFMACIYMRPCSLNHPGGLLLTGKPQPPVSNMPVSKVIPLPIQRQKGQGQEEEARSVK